MITWGADEPHPLLEYELSPADVVAIRDAKGKLDAQRCTLQFGVRHEKRQGSVETGPLFDLQGDLWE